MMTSCEQPRRELDELARDVQRLRRSTRVYGSIAVLALIAATGAVSWAAATVGSSQVINNSLRSIDLRNGQVKTADLANSSVRSAKLAARSVGSRELAVVPAAHLITSSGASIASGFSGTLVPFTFEELDTAGMWNLSDATHVIIPRTGIYSVSGHIVTTSSNSATATVFVQLYSRDTSDVTSYLGYDSATGPTRAASATSTVKFQQGTKVSLLLNQFSGSTQSIDSAIMSIAWIGPAG